MKKKQMNKKKNKILKIIPYSFFLLLLLAGFFIEEPVYASNYDKIIFKLTNVLLLLSVLIPFFILTSKTIRLHLPMFKKRKWWSNVFGSFLIFLVLGFSAQVCNNFHTEFYKSLYEEYQENEKIGQLSTKDADCLEKEWDNLSTEQTEETFNTEEEYSYLKIHYLDVGQGDSTFIELPNKKTMLIDAGEAKEADKIIEYIQNIGYQKIDYIIGTHPHTDHIGGLSKVIETFDIGSIYMPKVIATSKTYENLLTTIMNKNLKIKTAKKDTKIIDEYNLKIEILSPREKEYTNINNYSVVLKINYHNHKFLFMGDAEKEVEENLQGDLSADIIKVGHHGSNTSSSKDFVKHVNPNYAIISVGNGNKYNHPHSDITKRWESTGAKIYQTNKEGTIIAISNGTQLEINASNNSQENNHFSKEKEEINYNSVNNEPLPIESSEIELISLSSKVKRGSNATLKIKGIPNTEYHISVIYSSKESSAKGLENKISDKNGNVAWTWKIGSNTKSGTYPVTITGGGITKKFDLIIE